MRVPDDTATDELVRRMIMRVELDRAKAMQDAAERELAVGWRGDRATWRHRLAGAIRTQQQVRREMREQYGATA